MKMVIKKDIEDFVITYPNKTYLEYLSFSFEVDNLSTFINISEDLSNEDRIKMDEYALEQPNNSNIFILDTNGQPFPRNNRSTDPAESMTKLWNILHNQNHELLTKTIFGNIDNNSYDKIFKEKFLQVINSRYNNQLKQDIETYIKNNPDKTYEDWIKQHDIFKKYVIDNNHIFAIMYLNKHPALQYWNKYSAKQVFYRTKVNEDPYKPNDPNIYVYKIENKNP